MGLYAKGTPPEGTPKKFNLKAFLTVILFMMKGKLLKKYKPSPFFAEDGVTSIVTPHILNEAERRAPFQ